MSGACLDENEVAELLSGVAEPVWRERAERHLDTCESCRSLIADLAALAEHEPGDATPTIERNDGRIPVGSPLRPGERVDHFEVVRWLGRGGMGEVYEARDTKLDRKVALKFVRPRLLGSGEAMERFQREARATARFSHPSIVAIHAVGEYFGRPYVALEFLEGRTLGERLDDGIPDLEETRKIVGAIAEALGEAHRHGVLHRDLKPANVHVADDGRVRVLDFGLAKLVGADDPERLTQDELDADPGSVFETRGTARVGTPTHMAPEQWRGEATTEATDVWALGVILYTLLSGERPFAGLSVKEVAAEVTSERPVPPLRPAGDDVPAALVELTHACLSKSPQQRPGTSEIQLAVRVGPTPVPEAKRPALMGVALVGVVLVATAVYVFAAADPPAVEGTKAAPHLDAPGPRPSIASGDAEVSVPAEQPAVNPNDDAPVVEDEPTTDAPIDVVPPTQKPRPKARRASKAELFGTRE